MGGGGEAAAGGCPAVPRTRHLGRVPGRDAGSGHGCARRGAVRHGDAHVRACPAGGPCAGLAAAARAGEGAGGLAARHAARPCSGVAALGGEGELVGAVAAPVVGGLAEQVLLPQLQRAPQQLARLLLLRGEHGGAGDGHPLEGSAAPHVHFLHDDIAAGDSCNGCLRRRRDRPCRGAARGGPVAMLGRCGWGGQRWARWLWCMQSGGARAHRGRSWRNGDPQERGRRRRLDRDCVSAGMSDRWRSNNLRNDGRRRPHSCRAHRRWWRQGVEVRVQVLGAV